MMDVTWEIRSGALIGRLNGEIDISNASAIHADILRGLSTSQGPLLLDLSGITYLDSAGIRVLFEVATHLLETHRALRVIVPERAVARRLLLIAKFDGMVPMHHTLDEALADRITRS